MGFGSIVGNILGGGNPITGSIYSNLIGKASGGGGGGGGPTGLQNPNAWQEYVRRWGAGGRQAKTLEEFYSLGVPVEQLYETPNVQPGYSTNYGGLVNELGFTRTLPGRRTAPIAQFFAEKRVAERNAQLMRQAQGVLRGGLETLQAYRPGGAAALTSGYYQGMANLLAGSRTEAPDLMFEFDRHLLKSGRKMQRREQNMNLGLGVANLAGGILGGIFGGGGGLPGLREGGVVQPQPGGRQVTVAEGGEPEAVIPLSKLPGMVEEIQEQTEGGAQGGQVEEFEDTRPQAPPPPLDRPDPDMQRELGAYVPDSGYMGQALSRVPGDPGADGYSIPGAAHYASQRMGLPSDVLHAAIRGMQVESDEDFDNLGRVLNERLDDILFEDEFIRTRSSL